MSIYVHTYTCIMQNYPKSQDKYLKSSFESIHKKKYKKKIKNILRYLKFHRTCKSPYKIQQVHPAQKQNDNINKF